MRESKLTISVKQGDKDLAATLESELLSSLSEELEQSLNTDFTLSVNNADGDVVGGLVASISYSWLLVKIVWVEESQRHLGVGHALMEAAERNAKALGCHSVWLDTSSPKSKQFYSKLGYEVFGELGNAEGQCPAAHHRWFMKKVLS